MRTGVMFSPAGDRLLAFHGGLKEAVLWDFNAGQLVSELTVPGGGGLRHVRLMPDEGKFLTIHENALAVWDFGSGKMLHAHIDNSLKLDSSNDRQSEFFLEDNRRLIIVHSHGASVWDAAEARLIHQLKSTPAGCSAVVAGHEPNTLLTVSKGKNAVLWDLESGRQRMVFDGVPADVYPAHQEVWFSADGRRLFLRHRAGQAIIAWDTSTGRISEEYYLVNDGNDLLVELPQSRQIIGSPTARSNVVTVGSSQPDF